jgi:chorismate mutase
MIDAGSPSDGSDALETIRREIDGVDDTLLSLFAQRLQLADKLLAAKAPQPGLPLRPGREIALLRRLIARAPAPLERELVVELWRALVAASLRRQRVIDVVVGGGRGDPTRLFDISARERGSRTWANRRRRCRKWPRIPARRWRSPAGRPRPASAPGGLRFPSGASPICI